MLHAVLGMINGQVLGIGIVVFLAVTAYLYFSKKAKLQKMDVSTPAEKADQARWNEFFDDIQEYQNDFPDVG